MAQSDLSFNHPSPGGKCVCLNSKDQSSMKVLNLIHV